MNSRGPAGVFWQDQTKKKKKLSQRMQPGSDPDVVINKPSVLCVRVRRRDCWSLEGEHLRVFPSQPSRLCGEFMMASRRASAGFVSTDAARKTLTFRPLSYGDFVCVNLLPLKLKPLRRTLSVVQYVDLMFNQRSRSGKMSLSERFYAPSLIPVEKITSPALNAALLGKV